MHPKCNYECKILRDCGARNDHGFTCTRKPGHEGDHVACGTFSEHDLAVWPQETPVCGHECPSEPGLQCSLPSGHQGHHSATLTKAFGNNEFYVWGTQQPSPPSVTGKALFYTTVEKALEEYARKRHMPRKDIVTLLHEHLVQKYTR